MSWLARSLANSLLPDHRDDGDDEDGSVTAMKTEERSHEAEGRSGVPENQSIEVDAVSRGVRDDLSELSQTLTRQFWGVASFLAPPPSISSSADSSPQDGGRRPDPEVSGDSEEAEVAETPRIAGFRSEIAEIGGRFRTGISRLSNNSAVSEISKIASTFLPFRSEEEQEEESEGQDAVGAVGVTDEVLSFARNISMHPETWLDFPLFHDFEDCDDFDMSDAQQEHALAVEYLAPRLGALRIELCPSHMSEGCFWKIYFVLLHSRLNKYDAELLSTPQIVEARAMLQRFQNQTKPVSERAATTTTKGSIATELFTTSNTPYETTTPTKTQSFDSSIPTTAEIETEKHPILTTEVKIVDKSVIGEEPPTQFKNKGILSDASIQKYDYDDDDDDDGDGWLEEEETGEMGASVGVVNPLVDDEDVSFSDLEEDDDQSGPTSTKGLRSSGGSAKDGDCLNVHTV